jgi:hypothetical protein
MCVWKELSVSMSFWINPEWNGWGNEESRKLYLLILDSSLCSEWRAWCLE